MNDFPTAGEPTTRLQAQTLDQRHIRRGSVEEHDEPSRLVDRYNESTTRGRLPEASRQPSHVAGFWLA